MATRKLVNVDPTRGRRSSESPSEEPDPQTSSAERWLRALKQKDKPLETPPVPEQPKKR